MKNYILFFLLIIFPLNIFAGIIVLTTGNNIEGISNISVRDQLVLYQQNGKSMSLPMEEVSAILYDDGRYEEIQHKSSNYQEDFPQETYSNAENETNIEYSAKPVPNNINVTKEEIQQQRTQQKAESQKAIKAWGNWVKSAFKGDKDGWNPAKNPLWNKESREKYSGGSAPETQSPTPSSSNDPAQSNDNNW
ncbi:MAG: hypothetical protein MJZ92_04315 [Paludibacteraceae bacterium]|nr:hypothetical protein [Paludibacteraceae bacterium]